MSRANDEREDAQKERARIARCLSGDAGAWADFQAAYGEIIYGYPMHVYRIPAEEAADFYVYAFEDGRIFRRVRSYAGRAPFRAFLLGFVLDGLVIDWMRSRRRVEMVPIEDVERLPEDADGRARHAPDAAETSGAAAVLGRLLEGIPVGRAVVLKLLHAEDAELTADEIQHLARASGRPVREILDRLEEIRVQIRGREAEQKEIDGQLETVHAWAQLHEQRLVRIDRDLEGTPGDARLREERGEVERRWRQRCAQRERLLEQVRRHKTTATYREIAELLNTTVGNVGSQIARVRREIQRREEGAAWA